MTLTIRAFLGTSDFQWVCLNWGLSESGSVFQWSVAQTLAGCKGTAAYLDDILIFGATKEEHDVNLNVTLALLAAKNIRLQMPKCLSAHVSQPHPL